MTKNPYAGDWYDVRMECQNGSPDRWFGCYANFSPLRLDAAERLANEERKKPYIRNVVVKKRKSYLEH